MGAKSVGLAILVVGVVAAGCDAGDGEGAVVSTTAAASSTTAAAAADVTSAVTTTAASSDAAGTTQADAVDASPCGDRVLDDLHFACGRGDWVACDDLFRNAPEWSACQRFGDTCGYTTTTPHDSRCQDLYSGAAAPHENWPGLPDSLP